MEAAYVFDELGEPINEGDVVIYENVGWIVTKIQELKFPLITNPSKANPLPSRKMMKVTLQTEFNTPVPLGGRIPKVFRSSKIMSQTGDKDPSDS
jgi:hypothetical protein